MGTKFASGKFAHEFCDICSWRFPYGTLKEIYEKDTATGIMACAECWNPSHPQLRLGETSIYDPEGLRDPRPDDSLEESREIVITPEEAALAEQLGILSQIGS